MDPQIESLKQYPCPICGHSEYQFGQHVAPGIPGFVPGTEKRWNMRQHLLSIPKPVIARLCVHCRNIQSFERQFTADSGESTST
ncbi:MAG: hypothetical protein U0929_00935 [Planctomycetaceae bacterium]